ncbi:hypothetical protein Taro_014471 [Colocasia esculenta]|uniref:Uncharacterized protein n=1 Tax=Colocasia esculenta TaxID=4460 RepID=A0A843UEM5_COLES|nr:hypothetical protein [Colocasia esculenta]
MAIAWENDTDSNSESSSSEEEENANLAFMANIEDKGRVEELLVAEELWNDHKKPFFFPFSSTATCTNHPLEVDQRNPHNSLTQLQWLVTNGKLCKKPWLGSLRPYRMWFRLEIKLELQGMEPVMYTKILGV